MGAAVVTRRELVALLGGTAAAWPLPGQAQLAMPVVGYLHALSPEQTSHVVAAFRSGLAEAGFAEGRNVRIEYRWAAGRIDALPALAADLVRLPVDVIAAIGGSVAAQAAGAATSTIPIVFQVGDADPVQAGLVASLSRPGGNLTGMSMLGGELGAKRLQLLLELVPDAEVIAILVNPANPNAEPDAQEIGAAVRAGGRRLVALTARGEGDFEGAFAALAEQGCDALIVTSDGVFTNGRHALVALAARHRVPAIYQWREFVVSGGLISYGADLSAASRQVGDYVGRILNGAKPADLPVIQPTTFELLVNKRVADSLGIAIPASILLRADEILE